MDRQKLSDDLLKVTETARGYMAKIIGDNDGVRLGIRSGKGCGGNEYDFTLVSVGQADPLDLYVDLGDGRKLYVKPMDFFSKLQFMTIDFALDDIGNRRILITNPNEKGRCGCGQSVSF